MTKFIETILCSLIINIVEIYLWSKLYKKKVNFKSPKLYIIFILMTFALALNYISTNRFLLFVVVTFLLGIENKVIFNFPLKETVISTLYGQFIITLGELIFGIALSFYVQFSQTKIVNDYFGKLIPNVIIAVNSLLLIQFDLTRNGYSKIRDNINNFQVIGFVNVTILLTFVTNILLALIYFKVNVLILLLVNTSLIIIYAYITYKILTEKSINQQYKAENDALINNLHEYEKMVDQHRVINHENKNQLGIIKTMIETKDETVLAYIDDLVENDSTPDETLLSRTSRIPAGGLQGIIYQKLLTMKKEQINYTLNISRDIKFLDFKKLDIATMVALCKIVGVFLDNAIEEVKKLEKTYIGIELYVEDDAFCIKVSNNYSRGQDFSRIEELGYTTKTNGHGYGLSLVREIIEKNDRLINERSVTGKYFNQVVKVLDMCER